MEWGLGLDLCKWRTLPPTKPFWHLHHACLGACPLAMLLEMGALSTPALLVGSVQSYRITCCQGLNRSTLISFKAGIKTYPNCVPLLLTHLK